MPTPGAGVATRSATIGAHVPPRPTTAPTPSLLYWRMQSGLIQVQLAQRAGVDRATIQRLEAGGEARLSTISKLAAALNVTPAQLQAQPPTD
jgi:predicted transcriptional regulator